MYSSELNVQVLIALLKKCGIKRVILNPGSSNLAFSGSVQNDGSFEIYSGVDERHSAYMACGMAAETNEPVVINCTGATSSRNYMPALTEAYYRKLPVLVVTSSQPSTIIGQLIPQVTNRLILPKDIVRHAVNIQSTYNIKTCQRLMNEALLELSRHGGGPVHINLEISYSTRFDVADLPSVTTITRIMPYDSKWPTLGSNQRVAIFIGSHKLFRPSQMNVFHEFVEAHNAVVLCDCTSSYEGARKVFPSLICSQSLEGRQDFESLKPELLIHLGDVSGDSPTTRFLNGCPNVWRVCEDGEIRDTFGGLRHVFEMDDMLFFSHYKDSGAVRDASYYEDWMKLDSRLRANIPRLPFSNPGIAKMFSSQVPQGSTLHLAILNSLRSFNYFGKPSSVIAMSNVGGFGIDGCMSTLIGASLINRDKLYFLVIGDLAFFYDLNSLGNRHIGTNLRILLVNNGGGAEFHMYNNPTSQFERRTGNYIAADGHFGNQSKTLVKEIASSLGFDYMAASNQIEFDSLLPYFLCKGSEKPIIFECFTTMDDESDALELLNGIEKYNDIRKELKRMIPAKVKTVIKAMVQ